GGGIYIVPSLGGKPRLIARNGKYPRFSPDGSTIAFSGNNALMIAPSEGGSSRELRRVIATLVIPLWSSDGKHILICSVPTTNTAEDACEWYVVPLEGG